MFKIFSTISLALTLSGCVAVPTYSPVAASLIPFDEAAHQSYEGVGTGSITGQAFLRQKGGGVVTCAGSPVIIVPGTAYFRRVMEAARSGAIGQIDPAARALAKQTMCDAQGNFTATGLRGGDWLVTTSVQWSVGYAQQGGGLLKDVMVEDGKQAAVLLTDADFYAR